MESILNVQHVMLDAMGLYQHHDAVAGTAKQYVADDYAYKLHLATEANNGKFSSLVNEHLLSQLGYSSDSWTWC